MRIFCKYIVEKVPISSLTASEVNKINGDKIDAAKRTSLQSEDDGDQL